MTKRLDPPTRRELDLNKIRSQNYVERREKGGSRRLMRWVKVRDLDHLNEYIDRLNAKD